MLVSGWDYPESLGFATFSQDPGPGLPSSCKLAALVCFTICCLCPAQSTACSNISTPERP